jgi:hypothetical protein
MEQLEARQMMAGDVVTQVDNFGNLYIHEAAANVSQGSEIKLSTQNGAIRVESLSPGSSLVDGQNFRDFAISPNNAVNGTRAVTGNVYVILGDGSDKVRVENFALGGSHREVHIVVDSVTGSAPDDDVVEVNQVSVDGRMVIETGAGNDTVRVSTAWIRGGSNPNVVDGLRIETGAGQDDVQINGPAINGPSILDGLYVQTYDSVFETDRDYVSIRDTIISGTNETLQVQLGGGNDEFRLSFVDLNDNDIDINAGAGNDTGGFFRVTDVDQVYLQMGHGSDNLDLQYSAARYLEAWGGSDNGFDTLTTRSPMGASTNSFATNIYDGWESSDIVRSLRSQLSQRPRSDFVPRL